MYNPEHEALIIKEHCRLRKVFVNLPRYGSMVRLEDLLGALWLPEDDKLSTVTKSKRKV